MKQEDQPTNVTKGKNVASDKEELKEPLTEQDNTVIRSWVLWGVQAPHWVASDARLQLSRDVGSQRWCYDRDLGTIGRTSLTLIWWRNCRLFWTSISNEFVPDSTSIASSIKYHAEFTTSFSPEKFETKLVWRPVEQATRNLQ
ncbi:glycogen phosphorylase [Trifolium repens]|nr:glycogen phosphorylase [Trifolium repens]